MVDTAERNMRKSKANRGNIITPRYRVVEQMGQAEDAPGETGAGARWHQHTTERAIGKSMVRYKTMRGYKSLEGTKNGVVLTQWLYSGEDEHDLLAEIMAA